MNKSFSIRINGTVQGVGFRPFIASLATKLNLKGYIENREDGVRIVIHCSEDEVNLFISEISRLKPGPARITEMVLHESNWNPDGLSKFIINKSIKSGKITTFIPPDIAMCDECIQEMFDPDNRRFLYPFTNCSHCGPRFTIIEELPYDRKMTSMKDFEMCVDCVHEYTDIGDRRYHAQTNCCNDHGPEYLFLEKNTNKTFNGNKATEMAIELLKKGKILAIKGIGGFHIACDPVREASVIRLRDLKDRPFKPFALMAKDLDTITSFAYLSKREKEEILSYQRPVLLLKKKNDRFPWVAPAMNTIGVMLPYTGIQHLLLKEIPLLLMTSGNLSGEILCGENLEAITKLSPICDGFLLHNRKIVNKCDDSVVKFTGTKRVFLRKARGFIPRTINLPIENHPQILSTGADQKGSFGLCRNGVFFGSQYLGDLSYRSNQDQYFNMLKRFTSLFDLKPEIIISDLHPNYFSTAIGEDYAESHQLSIFYCQHHVAHVYSVMAEKKLRSCIGVSFDGTGYGSDGKAWGGEFFYIRENKWERIAHLRNVSLPGGELAIKRPELMSASYLVDSDMVINNEKISKMLTCAKIKTSSAGRLFDGVAALLGICKINTFEGEAPMRLEAISRKTDKTLPWTLDNSKTPWELDFREMIRVLNSQKRVNSPADLGSKFHYTVSKAIVETCRRIKEVSGENQICLSGGVFQNALLLEQTITLLESKGFKVYSNELVSPNDEGIALGQTYWYLLGCDK